MVDRARTWHASAPTRVCDAGGWTDTWFAGHGRVVNLAVSPHATASVVLRPRGNGAQVRLLAPDVGADLAFDIADPPHEHPLLEQAIVAAAVGDHRAVDATVRCDAPPGASMGTSASVMVALIAALDAAVADEAEESQGAAPRARLDTIGIARRAHHVETELVGRQAGIQDQLAAVSGGASDIVMTSYPEATVRRIPLTTHFVAALDASLVTVHLGSHDSSAVHRQVIEAMEGEGPSSPRLARLREAAGEAAAALGAGDLATFAAALRVNTDAQAALHPALVGDDAIEVIELARDGGALGWKVNGAGGSGGTVTIVCPPHEPGVRRAIEAGVAARRDTWRTVPTALAGDGVRVWADATEGRP